ncbi:MAG: TldD/PmbA family protein [Clostridia bacterium]|nr:TldD/PmbA family protein [Clostridia bacterium]
MMTFEQFRDACFKCALEQGCESAEIYSASSDGFSVNVLNAEIIKYAVERNKGLNLRVLYGGKTGYAYTEVYEDPEILVAHAIDNAKAIENTDESPMQGACEYPEITEKPNPVVDLSEEEKIDLALRLERDTLAYDPRVNRMGYCSVDTGVAETHISNTLGLKADRHERYSYAVLGPILREGDEEHESYSFKFGAGMTDYADIIRESVENTLMQFHASAVDSGEYRILLRNDAAGDLLSAFAPMFFAERVQKGLSLLTGKLGQPIASEAVTIVDDPFEADNPRAFDAEGVPSVLTAVIEKGVLKNYLYNLKSALKDGVASTSNAGRMGPAGAVTTAPSNFYIEKGEQSADELKKALGNGLLITELSGLHAGLNPISGDFSLIAKGQLVENGEIVRSVDQITVAGNFLALMQGIEAVGSDLRFGPPGFGRIGSPSLLIEKLIVSGK